MHARLPIAYLSLLLIGLVQLCGFAACAGAATVETSRIIYSEPGMFGGWPANHGMWSWDNEILVGFSIGYHKDLGKERHNIDRERPEHHVLARSLDGGETWTLEYPAKKGMLVNQGGMRHGITDPTLKEADPIPITEPIDFENQNFCMTLRFQNIHGGRSRMYYSYDRGHNWLGPFAVPLFGQTGIMARTDYLVNGRHDCLVFLTASKQNGKEGHIICGQTTDGGRTWKYLSHVGPEPNGFSIMPSTVRLDSDQLLMTTRRRAANDEPKHRWIDSWRSIDNGQSWQFAGNPVADVGEGNPPSLIRLRDGRLCLTYGVRQPPYEIQAKLSRDEGRTWSAPIVLQSGGGGRDIGYPRSLERPDGIIVTVYYFEPGDSPYRRILATIWSP